MLQASKMGLAGTHPSGLPFFCPNGDHLSQPPPAHMGIPPYGALDASKAAAAGEYWPPHGPSTHPTHWKRLLAAAASTGQQPATSTHPRTRTHTFILTRAQYRRFGHPFILARCPLHFPPPGAFASKAKLHDCLFPVQHLAESCTYSLIHSFIIFWHRS